MTDEMLRQAAEESLACFMDTVARNCEPAHAFHPSPALERKIGRLARRASRSAGHKLLYRVASVALAATLAGGAWLAVNPDARAGFIAWTRKMFENIMVYDFYGTYHEESLPEYVIDPPPEGFVETEFIDLETICVRVYESDDELIQFTYMVMSDQTTKSLFSDSYRHENVQVGTHPGDFYEESNPEQTNELLWFDERNGVVFQISAFLKKDAMLELAEHVKKK